MGTLCPPRGKGPAGALWGLCVVFPREGRPLQECFGAAGTVTRAGLPERRWLPAAGSALGGTAGLRQLRDTRLKLRLNEASASQEGFSVRFDSERKPGSASGIVPFPLPSVNDAPRRIFLGCFFQQARGDCWFLSHKNLCGLKEWEITPQLSFELYLRAMPVRFRRSLCSQMLCIFQNPPK